MYFKISKLTFNQTNIYIYALIVIHIVTNKYFRYTDKMSNDIIANDKTASDKMSKDKTANDKMSNATKQLKTKCLMRQND